MKKYIIYTTILIITLLAFSKAALVVFAETVSDNSNDSALIPTVVGSNSTATTPVTAGSNNSDAPIAPVIPIMAGDNGSGTIGTPVTTGDNGTGGNSGVPVLVGENGSGDTSGIPTSGGDNSSGGGTSVQPFAIVTSISSGSGTITCGDAACPSTIVSGSSLTFAANPSNGYTFTSWGGACSGTASTCTLVVNANESVSASFTSTGGNGGSSYSGGGGGFLGGGFSPVPLASSVVASTTINSCPLLTSYLQFGGSNSSVEVSKLQAFLKASQGLNVTINGMFDVQTENAVKAFQTKYLSQVMGPWGATQPSGYVYITTEKKINELACKTPFVLTPSESAIINAYKNQENQAGIGSTNQFVGPNGSTLPLPESNGSTTTPIVGQNGTTTSDNTAAAANAPAFWRFWNFIKSLF